MSKLFVAMCEDESHDRFPRFFDNQNNAILYAKKYAFYPDDYDGSESSFGGGCRTWISELDLNSNLLGTSEGVGTVLVADDTQYFSKIEIDNILRGGPGFCSNSA